MSAPFRVLAPRPSARGFALIVTVVLVAFLVLILVGLATFTRVETQVASNAQSLAQARQNALMALNLAVGQLQRHAGPDQRATASSSILDTDPTTSAIDGVPNARWTGVWDSTAAGGPVTWLVSGNENNALARLPTASINDPAAGNDNVWPLDRDVAPADKIKLPKSFITSTNVPGTDGAATQIGAYAWWVSDESQKVRLDLAPAESEAAAAADSAEARGLVLSARQFAAEQIDPSGTTNPPFALFANTRANDQAGSDLRAALGRVLAPEQVPFLDTAAAPALTPAALRANRHETTLHSLGVLADTRLGGLRKDLSYGLRPGGNELLGDLFDDGDNNEDHSADWEQVSDFVNIRAGSAVTPRAASNTQQAIGPIVLLIQMLWGAENPGTGNLRLLLQPMVVLANPYDVALNAADYTLVWQQRTDIRLYCPGNRERYRERPEELTYLGEDPILNIRNASFLPGEAKVFTMQGTSPIPYAAGSGVDLGEDYNDLAWAYKDLGPPTLNGAVPSDETRIRVEARPSNPNDIHNRSHGFILRFAGGAILQTTEGTIPGMETPGGGIVPVTSDNSGSSPFLGAPSRIGLKMAHVNMNYQGDTTGMRWLDSFNIRARSTPYFQRDNSALADPDAQRWRRNAQYYNGNPSPGGSSSQILDEDYAAWGPNNNYNLNGQRFMPLFHLPREAPRSLAVLRHALLFTTYKGPSYVFAHGYASPHFAPDAADPSYQLNQLLWDRYFFSSLPHDAVNLPATLPNPRLTYHGSPTLGQVQGFDTAAAHLMQLGPININSTSTAFWRSVLASLSGHSFHYRDSASASQTRTLGVSFLRSPNPSGDDTSDEIWRGYRTLTAGQLDSLAEQIVVRIKQRGPFRSLSEFMSRRLSSNPTDAATLRSALQDALDTPAAGINPDPALAPQGNIPATVGEDNVGNPLPYRQAAEGHRSSNTRGWLNQADLIEPIAPVITTRGDTFLVRTYGEARNPATGEIVGRAWIEAVCQRVPEYIGGEDAETAIDSPSLSAESVRFGRRIKIVSFRWLSSDEV